MSEHGLLYGSQLDEELKRLQTAYDQAKTEMKETEKQIDVKVDYALEINYEHLADCTIDMTVRARDGGELHIL